jgi:exopolysaccharide biosynthesis protein
VRATRACAGVIAVALISIGAFGGSSPRAEERPARNRKTTTIAPGLTLTKIQRKHPKNRIRVLTMTPSSRLTLDVALANDTIPGHEHTTSMARRHGAIAAINGDYTLLPLAPGAGRPVGTFAEDGNLVTSPLIWGRNFSIARDESTTYFGHARLRVDMFELDVGKTWRIKRWNDWVDDSDGGSLSGYTTAGAQLYRPLPDACSVRLYPSGTMTWGPDGAGVTQGYTVDQVKCSEKRLARRGGVVLSTPRSTRQAARLQESLVPNETVTITWSMGWGGVLDTIGGNPDVVENGQLAAGECSGSYFCLRNPRTGVGVRADGKILLVTVDGRQKNSKGMTLDEFGKLFQSLGATWALNLDGGGSTTMVVRNEIVNVPSGPERAVGSALLVLPGADEDEPLPGPYQSPTPVPTLPSPIPTSLPVDPSWLVPLGERSEALGCAAVRDPGSTGGMLDALARGDLTGERVPLPRPLRAALGTFRSGGGCPAQRFAG